MNGEDLKGERLQIRDEPDSSLFKDESTVRLEHFSNGIEENG